MHAPIEGYIYHYIYIYRVQLMRDYNVCVPLAGLARTVTLSTAAFQTLATMEELAL